LELSGRCAVQIYLLTYLLTYLIYTSTQTLNTTTKTGLNTQNVRFISNNGQPHIRHNLSAGFPTLNVSKRDDSNVAVDIEEALVNSASVVLGTLKPGLYHVREISRNIVNVDRSTARVYSSNSLHSIHHSLRRLTTSYVVLVYFYLCFAYCNCTVVLIVWTIGQVLVLCAAFLCLSNRLMLLFFALCHVSMCQLLKLNMMMNMQHV